MDEHALYEQAIKDGLDAIEQDRRERDAQRREEMRQPIEPKAPPVIIVRETTLQALGYAPPEASATIAGDGGGLGDGPGSSGSSSSSAPSSSSASSSSAPSSSSVPSSSVSSSSSVPSSSAPSSSSTTSMSSSSSSSSSMSHGGSGGSGSSSVDCCTISVEAFVGDCVDGMQTIALSMTATFSDEDCTDGSGIITIGGTPFGFDGIAFTASIDVACPGGSVDASIDFTPECPSCTKYSLVSSSDSCDGVNGNFPFALDLSIPQDGSPIVCH